MNQPANGEQALPSAGEQQELAPNNSLNSTTCKDCIDDGSFAFILFSIIVASGILGGLANAFMNLGKPDNAATPHTTISFKRDMWKHMILGITAAAIVPLLLNTISSSVLKQDEFSVQNMFIFAGFCVLAAVFSKNFLENMYNRMMQQMGDVKKEIADIRETSSEPDDDESQTVTGQAATTPQLSANEQTILNVLSSGTFTYRSISGIVKDSGLERATVDATLNSLIAQNLVLSRSNTNNQLRYYLSGEGRRALGLLGSTTASSTSPATPATATPPTPPATDKP